MDIDWCLSCEKHIEYASPHAPYCSADCFSNAQPAQPLASTSSSISIYPSPSNKVSDASVDSSRIRRWVSAIPSNDPAGAPIDPFSDDCPEELICVLQIPRRASSSLRRSPSPRPQQKPKLINRTSATTPLPTLCVSTPAQFRLPVAHPTPMAAQASTINKRSSTSGDMIASTSGASTSLTSLLSDPLIATPSDCSSSFGFAAIATHVKAWVHPSKSEKADHRWEYEEDKVSSSSPPPFKYASHQPARLQRPRRSTSPAQLQSPPLTARERKAERKLSSITSLSFALSKEDTRCESSHTPTPVMFPSCRTGECEDDFDILVAPSPPTRACYTRCPDPVDYQSDSSSCSMVQMKTKPRRRPAGAQWSGARGRRGVRAVDA